jgi:hypothetical protein
MLLLAGQEYRKMEMLPQDILPGCFVQSRTSGTGGTSGKTSLTKIVFGEIRQTTAGENPSQMIRKIHVNALGS